MKFHCNYCAKDGKIGKDNCGINDHIKTTMHKRNKGELANAGELWKPEWGEKYGAEGIGPADEPTKFHCRVCNKDYELSDRERSITTHIDKERHQRLKRGEQKMGMGDEDLAEYAMHGIRVDESGELFCEHCHDTVYIGSNSVRTMVEKHIYSQKHLRHANAVDELDHNVGFVEEANFDSRAAWNRRKLTLH
jgi:hypothetical protein